MLQCTDVVHIQMIKSLLIVILLSACSLTGEDGKWKWYTPRIWHFKKNIPQDNNPYSSGFRGGCNDGMGLSGYGAHRLHEIRTTGYGYYYNSDIALTDEQYKQGYNDGFNYCGTAANSVVGF